MKKLLCFLTALSFIFLLTSCKVANYTIEQESEEQFNEPVDDTSFDEYLNKAFNSLTIDKVNELFPKKVNTSIISDYKVPNSNISFEIEGFEEFEKYNELNASIWQEEKTIYAFSEEKVLKLELSDLQYLLDRYVLELNDKSVVDIIDLFLNKITGTDDVNLENLITKVKLTSNDFIEKDNKIYELKRESLVKIIVTITNGKTTNEKVGQVLDKYFEKLVVNVKYDNGKIRNIGIIVEVNLVDMELKSSLSIKPVYNEDEIESLEYGVNYSINYFDSLKKDFIINGYGTIKTDGISLNIKLKMETTTEISISLSNENLELSYLELDEKNDIEKNFALVLTFKEKTLNSMTITYSFKENRNRKYFIVILNPLEEFEIPDITKEDAIDFLDYFIEDEKN